jgi:TonB-dependent starch-binding outer membrane protein SusC
MASRTFVSRTATAARNLMIAMAFAAFGAVGVSAQNTGTVTGLVRDAVNLAPLAGAQVSIEGTGIGGLVNNVGRFLLLNVPAGTHTLNVTMIGYSVGSQTVTVTAGGTATSDFTLREQALSLEGVVVTGTAGQARRREVGNTIESIGQKDIQVAAITDVGDVLQGRAAGVQISDTDGQVGAGSEIRIRGNSSVTQGNRPLIYIDGVRMETGTLTLSDEAAATPMALDAINPNDIDRIEIVKGPAATTLYGTEAAGGVIQIFTKRGSAGAPAWTIGIDGGMSRLGHQGPNGGADLGKISNFFSENDPAYAGSGDGSTGVDWLNEGDATLNQNGLRVNDCVSGDDLSAYANITGYGAEPGCPTNGAWVRDAYMQRYNLSVRGGGETATYFVSGRYADEKGVVDPQGQDSYNVRANIQFQPFDGLDISLNNMYTRRNITWIPNGNNASGLFLNVLRGERGYTPGNDDSLVLFNDINTYLSQWVSSASVGWSPTQSFSHRLNFGMDYNYSDYVDFKPFGNYEFALGSRQNDTRSDRNLTFDYNGSWRTDLTTAVSSSFSWGGQVYEEFSWGLEGRDGDFAGPGDQLVGDGTLPFTDEDRLTIRSGGFFLQEQVGFGDRLFITGGVRWDGFSTFGDGFGLAAYPKLSAAYTISDESFFPQGGFVDALKLRAAWGKSGRAPGAFDAVKVYGAVQADELVPGLTISNLGNADLGPEISQELEAGFEVSMLNGRVSADFTYFDQKTLDALVGVQEAPSFGTNSRTLRNIGETANSGTETVLNVIAMRSDNLEWSVSGAYATNNSEILDLGPLDNAGFNLRVGFPIGVEYDRVVTNPFEVGAAPEYSDEVLGVTFPTQLFSIGTRVTWNQSLTFDILGEGQRGHYKTAGIGWATSRRETWPACYGIQNEFNANGITNLTPAQQTTCVPSNVRWGMWTDRADFLKIRSASLSYRLPEGLVPGTRSMTLALQAKNLAVFTDYQGLDPEASDRGNSQGEFAFEYYNLAPPRVFILNLTVNF